MDLHFIFSKVEKGVSSYISGLTPVSESTNLAEALVMGTLDTEKYDDTIADEIYKKYSDACIALNTFLTIEVYKDSVSVSNLIGTITVRRLPLSVKVDLDKLLTTPEIDSIVNMFASEMASTVVSIFAVIAVSTKLSGATPSSLISSASTGGSKATPDVDRIINMINTQTKGTVVTTKETLDDYVCGDLLKEELQEITDFFKNEALYKSKGIKIPKGILFKGVPGTGKTYAARCIAGSVDCYFITCTASSLQGMYIGSGAENIRNLFQGAKTLSEASGKGVIIFIDEVDSFGSRESHSGSSSDESDRTLNQLLAEMSGFEDTEKIMVIAATNYPERLDDALMRSGRFSRQINIEVPETEEREHMLEFYFNKIKMPIVDTNIVELATLTEGMTPADICEISNEAGILTIRKKLNEIHLEDINEAINKVITKSVRSPDKPTMNYELIAAHEIGHVLAELIYNKTCPLKVTNYSYGNAGGFTQSTNKLSNIPDETTYLNRIRQLLGGRVAEKVIMGYCTTGASDDLRRAKRMLTDYYQTYHFKHYETKDLDQIVLNDLENLEKEMIDDFKKSENFKHLVSLTKELVANRILYTKDILRISGDLIITEDIF